MTQDRMVFSWDSQGRFTVRDAGPDDDGLPQTDITIYDETTGTVVYDYEAPDDARRPVIPVVAAGQ